MRLVDGRANGELSDEYFGVSQRFSKSLPGRLGQFQELIEGDPSRDVGQLVDDIEAEGLRYLDLFSFIEESFVPDLPRFLQRGFRLLGKLRDRFLGWLKLLNW